MVCYGPRIGTIAVASAVVYVFLHRVIGRILHIAGLVLEITLITGLAAAAAMLVIWTVRAVQRRRAAAGACTTCRFRCQQSLIPHSQPAARHLHLTPQRPQPGRPLPWPGNPQPTVLPPRVPGAQADDRPEARPLVLR
jgi:hypothetical protein